MATTAVVLLGMACRTATQTSSAGTRPSPLEPRRNTALADYQGVYAYQGGVRLLIVAADTMLFAVLDEAKYPLRELDGDRFLNASGDTIPFRRDASGVVSGFVERGVYFPRQTRDVDPGVAADVRATARPREADGRPARYSYAIPADMRDGLAVGDVGSAGIDTAAVTRLVNRVVDGTYPDMHAILVYRGGKLVIEEYFYDYDRDRPHQLRSASKSIISALVGIAMDRGILEGDSALVMKHLPYERYENPDPRKSALILRDLLTMRSGLACNDWDSESPGNESRVYQSEDWVKFVLDLPVTEPPGTHGSYCSGNVAVAGRIVERAAGMSLPSFAQNNLFAPLGIRAQDVRWNYTLSLSNATTFGQLYLRPRDMLKIGILFQQQGSWNGRQIISREWVARSTAHWSHVGDQDYGYFWWHQWVNIPTTAGAQRVDMVAASGNGGQRIFIVPSLDLVVVMTGGNYNSQSPASAIMVKELLPAVASQPVTPAPVIAVSASDSHATIVAKAAKVVPSPQHLAWQRGEVIGFVHFGINTFTDREWGTGTESPALFNPSALDARQWMRAFKSAGITEVVLVVKHHDGFVLYPTRYTAHSVKASPWLNGHGDVMRAVVEAAKETGLKVGFYLSPADLYQKQQGVFGNRSAARTTRIPTLVPGDDRHPREFLTYDLDDYNRYFMNQMYELLTEYGPISEVWLDGAPAAGSGQPYAFTAWYDIVHRLQPDAVIFNQNVRWVGNEDGKARKTEWSVIPLASDYNVQPSGDLTDADLGGRDKLFGRGVHFLAWYPAEADVSMRPGWFWHFAQDSQVKSLARLMEVYYATVGRNAVMMLNVPPDRRGLFTDTDVQRLKEFGDRVRRVFKTNLAEDSWKSAKRESDGNVVVDLELPVTFNRIMLGEDIARGQRVEAFAVDEWDGGGWKEIAAGTTIGYKRLLKTNTVRTPKVRVRILASRAPASIKSFGLFLED